MLEVLAAAGGSGSYKARQTKRLMLIKDRNFLNYVRKVSLERGFCCDERRDGLVPEKRQIFDRSTESMEFFGMSLQLACLAIFQAQKKSRFLPMVRHSSVCKKIQ